MARVPDPMKLVVLAANGLADLREEELRAHKLNLELEVSVWLRRSGADLAVAPRALLALRRALVEVSGLDSVSEPIPLPIADHQLAVANLCVYLHGLINRGTASSGLGRRELVDKAIERLQSAWDAARLTS